MGKKTKSLSLGRLLFLLTFLFVFAQVSFFITNLYLIGLPHILTKSILSSHIFEHSVVLLPLARFILTQIALYSLFVFIIWCVAITLQNAFGLSRKSGLAIGLLCWLLGVTSILIANTVYFHHSIFNVLWVARHPSISLFLLYSFSFICCAIIFLDLSYRVYKKHFHIRHYYLSLLIILFGGIYFYGKTDFRFSTPTSLATKAKPNIIIISVEALRPEFISDMPFLASQLKQSTQFTQAYTPIAQSFPSWMSLISAKTPLHNGARSLFTDYKNIDFRHSLLSSLKSDGYQTFYAVDGQRFGEITEQTGFDHIISPAYGAAELVIGSISDFPIINLFATTALGKWLFPYSYANRSVDVSYDPANYLDLLTQNLSHRSDQPLLLAAHFSLSHWPYTWANDTQQVDSSNVAKYRVSLKTVDKQIQQLMAALDNQGLLDHALVIFMSDHGIGLGIPGDRVLDEKKFIGKKDTHWWLQRFPYTTEKHYLGAKEYKLDTSYGYSSDILSLVQSHVLLAFRAYHLADYQSKEVTQRASLLDITPTLLDLLKLPAIKGQDGISLLPFLTNANSPEFSRALFLETGFTTPQIATEIISVGDVLQTTFQAIGINPETGLFYLSPTASKTLLLNKQRAILFNEWLLARYPAATHFTLAFKDHHLKQLQESNPAFYVLVNLKTGEWTTDLDHFRKDPKVSELMHAFINYNASENIN